MTATYDADRYAPTSVAVLLQLPESSTRAFLVASALGRILDTKGTSERVRNGKSAAGTRIDKARLPVVLEVLAISDRQWRRYVAEWVGRYTAHRCGQGRLFLFARKLPEFCAGCGDEVIYDHSPPSPRPNRGPGFGRDASVVTDVVRPQSGAVASASPAQLRPLSRTDASHLQTGINGMEVGVPVLGGLELEALERLKKTLGAVEIKTAAPSSWWETWWASLEEEVTANAS